VESGGNRAANLGGSNLVVNANSENPEAAYAYARFAMTDPEAQLYMMETYGLFPSLLETYEDPFFDKKVPYFNDQPIFRMFADEVPDIPAAYYTEDYARALERSVDAQSQVLLDGGDPEQALNRAAEQLAQETDREIA
jgi:lactose/L-arabinose transport system substrate-binding protein